MYITLVTLYKTLHISVTMLDPYGLLQHHVPNIRQGIVIYAAGLYSVTSVFRIT